MVYEGRHILKPAVWATDVGLQSSQGNPSVVPLPFTNEETEAPAQVVLTEISHSSAVVGVNTDLKKVYIIGDDQRGHIVRHNRTSGLGVAAMKSKRTWDRL